MNKEKALTLLLLDLAAFACTRSGDRSSRREFEAACELVEKILPFDAQVYKAHVAEAARDGQGGNGRRKVGRARPARRHCAATPPA